MAKPATPRADALRRMREEQYERDQAAIRAAAKKAPEKRATKKTHKKKGERLK